MGIIHMNGRIFDPLMGRFMSADPFIQEGDELQSFNRYSYVMNNPLNYTDPSGFVRWKNIRGWVVKAIAGALDYYTGCSGCFSAAVGAYDGSKNGGGLKGAVVGGVQGYFGYQNGGNFTITGYAVSAGLGCAGAAAQGGNCGRGAAAGVVNHFGSQYDFEGQTIAGCVSGRINGGSCGQGARDAATSYAVSYVVRGSINAGIGIYQEYQERLKIALHLQEDQYVACVPCLAPLAAPALGYIATQGPRVISYSGILWAATVAYIGSKIDNVFSVNNAENPEATNGKDSAKGVDNAAPPVPGVTGGEKTGNGPRIWDKSSTTPVGDSNNDFDRLFPNGDSVSDKGNGVRVGTRPDGGRVIVRPGSSDASGNVPTIEIQNPRGKPLDKIRYN
jgi:hypothetical protein